MTIRPSFFNYLVYGSADPIFQDLEKKKNTFFNFFLKNNFIFLFSKYFLFFLQIFICISQARSPDKGGGFASASSFKPPGK